MNDIEYKDIPYKKLLILLITSAVLFQFGYWSTFQMNVLGYMTINDMVTSFIYPFLGTFLSYIFYLFSDFFEKALIKVTTPNKLKSKNLIKAIIIYVLIALVLVYMSFKLGVTGWIIVPFLAWFMYSSELVTLLIQNKTIPENIELARFTQIAILLFLMSFCLGKRDGVSIEKNYYFNYIQVEDNSSYKTHFYKLIGNFGDFIILESLDNTEKVVSKIDKYEPLRIYNYFENKTTTKRDSVMKMEIKQIKK